MTVTGAGVGGLGAIINTGGGQNNALHNVILAGNTTFGGPGRWDIRTNNSRPGRFQYRQRRLQPDEGGRKPILAGGRECGCALADIDVKAGMFSYELTTTGLGNPANTLTARSGSTLLFWDAKVPLNKNITLENGSTIHAGSGTANSTIGPINLAGGMANLSSASGVIIYYNGAINGPGGIIKGDAGSVHLTAANSFAGNVIHNYGNLLLSNSLAVGNNKTLSVNYNTGVSGGNGVRLYLRNGITTPSDVTGVFTSTSSGGDYRTSITSDVLTNTWSGPCRVKARASLLSLASPRRVN